MASKPDRMPRAMRAAPKRARSQSLHDGFIRHQNYLWAKIATALCVLVITVYFLIDVTPRPNGGSWYGYTLGTVGVLIILWLTMLGVRKRAMTAGRWSLKAWTSAHIYLGLSLIVIGTLHTGFQLGWNVHTLAWVMMMVVILSGMFGIGAYAVLPERLSTNRDEMTEPQMLDALKSIDRQLYEAAQPLDQRHAALVQMSLDDDPLKGGILTRLGGRYPRCATRSAHIELRRDSAYRARVADDPLEKIDALFERKQAMLARMRRHAKLKALLEVWLYIHVPMTFALLAALSAHIVSVFFYW